jgi:hypothetical protein
MLAIRLGAQIDSIAHRARRKIVAAEIGPRELRACSEVAQ